MNKKSKAILTVTSTVLVIFMLLLTAPVHAVTLSMEMPSKATVNSVVNFDLKTDLAAGENIPIDTVTLELKGPRSRQVCVFRPDGTPVSGCDGLSIKLTDESAKAYADRSGSGWDGNANFNTSFGYGYGFGATQSSAELTWNVQWDTKGKQPGRYTAAFHVTSTSDSVSRTYNLKSTESIVLTGKGLKLEDKTHGDKKDTEDTQAKDPKVKDSKESDD